MIQVRTHHLDDLSSRALEDFGRKIGLDDESSVSISLPAGPNREFMAEPVLRFVESLGDEFPNLSFRVRAGVDDCELQAEDLKPEQVDRYSEILQFEPKFSGIGCTFVATLQPETNSVLECVQAMQEAAGSAQERLMLVPRDNFYLTQRVARGLARYSGHLTMSDSLKAVHVVQIPGESQYQSLHRTGSEAASFIVSELISLTGQKSYESFTERNGVFGRILDTIHNLKVWMSARDKTR